MAAPVHSNPVAASWGRLLNTASSEIEWANARLEAYWAGERSAAYYAAEDDGLLDVDVWPVTNEMPATRVAGVRELCEATAGVAASAEAGKAQPGSRSGAANGRRAPEWLELDVPVVIRLDVGRTLRAVAAPVARCLRSALVVGTPARRGAAVAPPSPQAASSPRVDTDALVAASVDSPAAPGSSSGSAEVTPHATRIVHARIDTFEDRCAMDELVLNQQRTLHAALSARVAQLEAKHREDALERQARLAALEREEELEKRLSVVEVLTSPARGAALIRRAASVEAVSASPRPALGGTPARLARALSASSALGDLPEDAASPLTSWPLFTQPGSDSESENTPPLDGTPAPPPRSLHLPPRTPRSPSADSDASDDSAFSASAYASPAAGAVMRQIPAFFGSLPPTPRSSQRRTPAAAPTPASGAMRRSSPPCGCRSPDSPEGSPTIHGEACRAQASASASSSAHRKPPLRRAHTTPTKLLHAALSPA